MLETALLLVRRILKNNNNVLLSRAIGSVSPPTLRSQEQINSSKNEPSWEEAKDYSEIPGPKPLPLMGNLWRFIPVLGEYSVRDMLAVWRKMNNQYGDFVKLSGIIGFPEVIFAYDPKDVEKIYKMENHMPMRPVFETVKYYREHFRQDVFKNAMGVFLTHGEEWYRQRNILSPVLLQPRIIKRYVPVLDDIAGDLVKRLRRIRTNKNKIPGDFREEANKWSFESIVYIALDKRLYCLSEDSAPEKTTELIKATEDIFRLIFEMDVGPGIWKYVLTPKYYQMMKALDTQFTISKGFVDEALARIEKEMLDGTHLNKELSVLEKLLEIDYNVAIVMALDMILAGFDSTSCFLLSILYYLSTNKSTQNKLRDEIYSVLSDDNTQLTKEHLDQMPYLKACLKEGSRIFPTGAGGSRILTKDSVVAGYRVKKGTLMMFPLMYVSRQEKHFPRPDEFIPERWLREMQHSDLYYKNSHPFCVVPFGFGPRACIGQRFAELELEVALVQLVKNFDISWDGPPPKQVILMFNSLKDLHFVFNDYERKY